MSVYRELPRDRCGAIDVTMHYYSLYARWFKRFCTLLRILGSLTPVQSSTSLRLGRINSCIPLAIDDGDIRGIAGFDIFLHDG